MKWLSRISPQERLIDSGTTASRSVSERIKDFGKNVLILLLAYMVAEGFLIRTYDAAYDAGMNAGYEWGHGVGLQEGSELGCMVKPI